MNMQKLKKKEETLKNLFLQKKRNLSNKTPVHFGNNVFELCKISPSSFFSCC